MSTEALPAPRARAARRPGTGTVYRWEVRKLAAQKRTYIGLGAALLVPLIFVLGLALDGGGGGPEEVAFGRYVRETGLAIPLVGLIFGSVWLFPLITALVAGDIVATEDHHGTLKTILTRSVERGQVFAGKALATLTYTFLAVAVFVVTGLVAGGLVWGFDPLVSLSGTPIPAGRGMLLIGAGALAYLVPMLAVASIALLLSTLTRNSAAAVVGTLMISLILQVLGVISALEWLQPYLLSSQFDAWQGLLREPVDWAPIIHSAWVSALYAVPAAAVALAAFVRRDVAGG
jgi:ABC-2 type transport system permease protein